MLYLFIRDTLKNGVGNGCQYVRSRKRKPHKTKEGWGQGKGLSLNTAHRQTRLYTTDLSALWRLVQANKRLLRGPLEHVNCMASSHTDKNTFVFRFQCFTSLQIKKRAGIILGSQLWMLAVIAAFGLLQPFQCPCLTPVIIILSHSQLSPLLQLHADMNFFSWFSKEA